MFLIRCRKCRGHTAVSDDIDRPRRCRECGRPLDRERWDVVDDPVKVRRKVLESLTPLADWMLVFGLAQVFTALVGSAWAALAMPASDPAFLISAGGGVSVLGGLIAVGGRLIRRGRWRLVGVAACVMTLFSPLVVGLPLGLWGLLTLSRPEVKAAFELGSK